MRIIFFLLVACFCFCSISFGQVTRNWTGPTNGLWSTSSNWSPNGSPGVAADNATNRDVSNFENPATVQLDFGSGISGNTLSLGVIYADKALTLANNSGFDGVIRLNGSSSVYLASGDSNVDIGSGTHKTTLMLGASNGIVSVSGGTTMTLHGEISQATQNSGLTKNSSGTLAFGSDNSFNGTLTVNGGSVRVGLGGSTGSVGGGSVNLSGATSLIFDRNNSYTVQNLVSGNGNVEQRNSSGVVTFSNITTTGQFTNTAGRSIIASQAAFSQTSIVGGEIEVTGSLGNGLVTLQNGSDLVLNRSGVYNFTNSVQGNGEVVQQNAGATVTFSNLTNTGGFVNDAGRSILSGTSNFSSTQVNGGTVEVTGSIGNNSVSLANGAEIVFNRSGNYSATNNVTGSGNVVQQNSGASVTFSNLNNTGTFTNVAGNSTISNNAAFSSVNVVTGTVTVTGSLSDSTVVNVVSGTFESTSNDTVSALTGGGNVVLGNTQLTIGALDGAGHFSGTITGSSTLTKVGSGTQVISGTANVASIQVESGVLQLGNGGTSGSLGGSTTVTLQSGATLELNRSDSFAFQNNISGDGSLIQSGAGTASLSGQIVTDSVSITDGALAVNGSLSSDTIVVGEHGRLQGTGDITAPTVTVNGTLAPGNSIGTINIAGSLDLSDGILEIEYDGSMSDLLFVDGNLDIRGATLDLKRLTEGSDPALFEWVVIAEYTSLQGTFGTILTPDISPNRFVFDYDFGGNKIAFSAVPEPSSLAMVSIVCLLGFRARFLRRRVAQK